MHQLPLRLTGVVESDSPTVYKIGRICEFQIISYNYNPESTQYDFSGVIGGRGWLRHEVDEGELLFHAMLIPYFVRLYTNTSISSWIAP